MVINKIKNTNYEKMGAEIAMIEAFKNVTEMRDVAYEAGRAIEEAKKIKTPHFHWIY